MKRIITITLALIIALALALACFGCKKGSTDAEQAGKSIHVGILQLTSHAALDAASEGFIKALADNGFVDGQNGFSIDFQNAQNDQSNLSTISDRFVSANCDLVLCVGTPAVQAMAGKTTEIPILGTAVTDFESANLVDSNELPGGNVSGTTDMNPIKEQIELLTQLAPDTKTIGCIYNGGEDNSILQANIAKSEIESLGLEYIEVTVTSTNDVQQAMQNLVGRCDAIYIPTDNTVASAMPIVSDVANGAKIPVICGESNMVAAGGLATLGINYYNLGYQTGKMAVRILVDGADISTMPIESLENMDYAINAEVVDLLGITIPEALQQFVG